jgi:hypothetical protein
LREHKEKLQCHQQGLHHPLDKLPLYIDYDPHKQKKAVKTNQTKKKGAAKRFMDQQTNTSQTIYAS